MKKILILLKKSSNYGDYNQTNNNKGTSKAGLYNSARLISQALEEITDVKTFLEPCIDGNDVDNKLFKYKPDYCIVEAIWVTPTKLKELQLLHPKVHFIVRAHSKIPFLAMEGIAIGWMKEYLSIPNVEISFNNKKTSHDLNSIGIYNVYLPNIYEKIVDEYNLFNKILNYYNTNKENKDVYNIGCFGAIRPLKNQLNQAVAAIKFGYDTDSSINFYVNSGRQEQAGENVLKNMRALFDNTRHNLVEVGWLERDEFLKLLSTMDISMQVSLTETFNIVAADSVLMEVPLVISSEIDWLHTGISDPNDVDSMVGQIKNAWKYKKHFIKQNLVDLKTSNKLALREWIKYLDLK